MSKKPPTGTVTFLFTDIEGSTRLWEQYPVAMKAALARHFAILKKAIKEHSGYIFKNLGDGVCAVFANARDAPAAALAAQRALQAEDWGVLGSLPVRMALHTGDVEVHKNDYFGLPLNRAERLLCTGYGGQILLSLATEGLVRDSLPKGTSLRDLGEHYLKDLTHPEHIFQTVVPDLPSDFPPLQASKTSASNSPIRQKSVTASNGDGKTNHEQGFKWWARYAIVPLLGSGGIIAIIVALLNRPLPVPPPPTAAIGTPIVQVVQATPTPMTTITSAPTATPTSTQTRTSAPTGTATPVNKSTPVPPTAEPPSTETPPTRPPTRLPTEEPTQEPSPTSLPPTSPPETSPTPEPTETLNPPTATPQPTESSSLGTFHKFIGNPQTCIEKEFPESAKTEGWEEGPCP